MTVRGSQGECMSYRRLWIALTVVIVASFSVLGIVGYRGIQKAPPIPGRVLTADGRVLFDRNTIQLGQGVWQSIGGQEVGSIFGHGAYLAPDWTADWLHREAMHILNAWAQEAGSKDFNSLPPEKQAGLKARLESEFRTNRYDASRDEVRISTSRARAFDDLRAYYSDVFASGRNEYAIPKGALTDPEKAAQMSAFFWWTSWVASTNRPGEVVTYTQNWPHEPLVANAPTGAAVVWSVISFVLLLAGIGGMVWYFASAG